MRASKSWVRITLEHKEHAMKLNTAQVARAVNQLEIEAIPEDHPLIPKLNQLFGDHTYFVDGNGLSIVEPAADDVEISEPDAIGTGVVVNLANWTDSNPPKLEVHEPEVTENMVALGTNGSR
jgi:hypothetical protein